MTPSRPQIAAIYARVSTADQNYDMQLTEIREYLGRMGWATVEYLEKMSSRKRRPELERLLADAGTRKFDVVVVWKLDRFGRTVRELVDNIMVLDQKGVRFICLTQQIDTDKRNPMSKLVLHMMAAFAEFERDLINERVKAGVDEYRRAFDSGRVGRERHSRSGRDMPPHRPKRVFRRDRAAELRRKGWSWRKIAKELDVPVSTVRDALANS
ncbi:MAG TPA: recombinase family protein [Bryobacteraceae bacterium]|nr:recombinase family protein [Bryobacteraceae bacterium]